ADLGPGQRDVPPPADRAADGTEDLLRRSALTLAARQQREHQWPAAPILPEGNLPQRMDRQPPRQCRRRAQRPATPMPRSPDTPMPRSPDTAPSHATMATSAGMTMIRNVRWNPPLIQRPLLPGLHLLDHLVGDPRDRLLAHRRAI